MGLVSGNDRHAICNCAVTGCGRSVRRSPTEALIPCLSRPFRGYFKLQRALSLIPRNAGHGNRSHQVNQVCTLWGTPRRYGRYSSLSPASAERRFSGRYSTVALRIQGHQIQELRWIGQFFGFLWREFDGEQLFECCQESTLDKKALIVISDGGDNASSHTPAEVIRLAEKSSTIIYTIGIIDDRKPPVLRRLARATGGEAFFPEKSGGWWTFAGELLTISATSTPSVTFPRIRRWRLPHRSSRRPRARPTASCSSEHALATSH